MTKKRVTVTIDREIHEAARALGLNVSATCELCLRRAVARLKGGTPMLRIMDDVNLLDGIAENVIRSDRNELLKAFARAWLLADIENKHILLPAWIDLIFKYELYRKE